jgi:hypothetical protein
MKKYVIIGLVLAVLAFASCLLDTLEKGGTIEVINDSSDYSASIYIMKGKNGIDSVAGPKTADSNGGKVTFIIDEDGTYSVDAAYFEGSTAKGHGSGEAVLAGGNKVTVRVKPSR